MANEERNREEKGGQDQDRQGQGQDRQGQGQDQDREASKGEQHRDGDTNPGRENAPERVEGPQSRGS